MINELLIYGICFRVVGADVPESFLDAAVLMQAMARSHIHRYFGGRSRGKGIDWSTYRGCDGGGGVKGVSFLAYR